MSSPTVQPRTSLHEAADMGRALFCPRASASGQDSRHRVGDTGYFPEQEPEITEVEDWESSPPVPRIRAVTSPNTCATDGAWMAMGRSATCAKCQRLSCTATYTGLSGECSSVGFGPRTWGGKFSLQTEGLPRPQNVCKQRQQVSRPIRLINYDMQMWN